MRSVFEDQPSAQGARIPEIDRQSRDDPADADAPRALPDLLAEAAQRVVDVVGCRCAAIAVWAADGRGEVRVSAGDRDESRRRFGHVLDPEHPLAGVHLEAATVRLAAGPDGSATMAVPVVVRGRGAGAVFVAGTAAVDELGAMFTDRDAAFLQATAVDVAGLIERIRTAEANRRRERWLTSGTEIARDLTNAQHPDPLAMITERAAEIADADTVLLLVPGTAPGLLRVEAATGIGVRRLREQVPDTDDGLVLRVFTDGRSHCVDDLRAATSQPDLEIDTAMFAPMIGSAGPRGVLAFGRISRGRFSQSELGMATMFAATVALALELAESQSRREQAALINERDRIARDLHDHVIQRLYAVGLTVQHVSSLVSSEIADRLIGGVIDIDAAITQIRATIFRLTQPILGVDRSLRARAEALVAELEPVLGFRPTLTSEGPLDFAVDDELQADCEAVLREALTNVARHASASRADLHIVVARGRVQLEIADNGVGLGDSDRRSGLGNLRRRAEQHGGTLEIDTPPGGGTRLCWSVPLDTHRR